MAVRPIGIDLFAGAGGMSLGFEQAGFDVVAALEIDPVHCAVHKFNFPQTEIICRDASKISGKEIRAFAKIGNRPIDVVFGGAPCQGFSLMGKRALDDPRNALLHHFVRLIAELKPKYFVFENVKGLTIGKYKGLLDEVIGEFSDCGYDVVSDYRVLNAAEYGVPQSRERVFLLGSRKGQRSPQYPEAMVCPSVKRINGFNRALPLGPSVADAILDLPDPERFEILFQQDWIRTQFKKPSLYARVMRGISTDSQDYSHPRRFDNRVLTSSLRTDHTKLSRMRFARTKPGAVEPVSRFYKLDPSGICNTLRAGTASDRGAFTSARPIHPELARCITNREAGRLHSYPDWFRFHKTKWHGFRQIGNSVPPLLARAVAVQMVKALGVKPQKPNKKLHLGDPSLLEMDMTAAAKYFGVSASIIGHRTRIETKDRNRRKTKGMYVRG
jgi:DNA (cytosine-5)-methyltransferase 1